MQLHIEVRSVIGDLISRNILFTVYDVYRIVQSKNKTPINYDDVRSYVRFNFSNGVFPPGWTNNIGDHLPYSPPPHIYAPRGANIKEYDPDALDPNIIKPKQQKVEYWYSLVNKKTGNRETSRRAKGNRSGFYPNKNGPSQLLAGISNKMKKDYEIVKYEVSLTPVGS